MAFQLSPGVNTTEKDLTSVVPAVATSVGALVGNFQWGPVEEITLVSSENNLVENFFEPNNATATDFFTAASFLAYANSLKLVRVVDDTTAKNAVSSGTAVIIKNDAHYDNNYGSGEGSVGMWAAKYPGVLGNSLKVSFADSTDYDTDSVASTTITAGGSSYSSTPTVAFSAAPAGGVTATGTATVASNAVTGITITNSGSGYTSAPTITISGGGGSGATATATLTAAGWAFADSFDSAPKTSLNVGVAGGSLDELHIIVVDEDGLFTGVANTVLERFANVSKASDAKGIDGGSIFYKDVINNQSKYIRWMDHPAGDSSWGTTGVGTTFTSAHTTAEATVSLTGGVTDAPDSGDYQTGWALFQDSETVDVNLLMTSGLSNTDVKWVQDNVAYGRKDCVSFSSPQKASVVNNAAGEVTSITADKAANRASSYCVLDGNWKYMYDRYNDVYRWVPCNGDVAGLCAETDRTNDAWWSPAGFNRGLLRNAVKLAWDPTKAQRDELYKIGVNPIINSPGNGVVLFGDRTLLGQPSAFDRINVRRLFIVLEKAISTAAKYQLFEFNDAFTRAQFVSMVTPFLRTVQGRRGIYDFKVICNESNNTGQVIDANEFVADIFIKPARAINFIQLNFIATRTGVSFDEIGG